MRRLRVDGGLRCADPPYTPPIAAIRARDAYINRMTETSSPKTIRPKRAPVFVCKNCLKRVADGPALKRALKAEIKRRGETLAIKKPRLVMTSCFGICPKRAVVVTSAARLQGREYLLLIGCDAASEATAVLMPLEQA